MNHREHMISNIGAGVLAGGIGANILTGGEDIGMTVIAVSSALIGSIAGQYFGPDLDISTSTPSNKGGNQIVLIFSFIISLIPILLVGSVDSFTMIISLILFIVLSLITLLRLGARGKDRHNKISSLTIYTNIAAYFTLIYSGYMLYKIYEIGGSLQLSIAAFLISLCFVIIATNYDHRGPTHSLTLALLIGGGTFYYVLLLSGGVGLIVTIVGLLLLGYSTGYINHIFMDFLGYKKQQLMFPVRRRFKGLGFYSTGNTSALIVSSISCIVYLLLGAFIILK